MKKDEFEIVGDRAFVFEAIVNRVLFDKEFAQALEKGKITQVDKVLKEMGVTIKRDQLRAMLADLKTNNLDVIRQLSKTLKGEHHTGV